jgi:hypothetical protein
MTQRQEFRVLETYKDFEIREYQPCVIAEVKVSAELSAASSKAFSSLFNYISKGNSSSEKISMTAPVIASQMAGQTAADSWNISFVMPAGSNINQMPDPNDAQVTLRELGTEVCVALGFRGKATAELSEREAKRLRLAATREKLVLSDEIRICRFDPPFKPGFLQRNEIVIPVYVTT